MKCSTFFLAGLLLLVSACTPKPVAAQLTVYFTNINRYAIGIEPYEDPVTRRLI